MPYIGNTIRAADDYRLIDDISSGFNGSTTSFALQVAGSAPVPFPKSPQQVLISVNGVIQEPDPTGASGFNLVGTNIVFSSAPTNGHAFFGIIYATADYLNSGGNFPTGSLGAPSITFVGDEDTGIYRKGSGSVGFVSDATEIANFDSNGITISSGNLIIPDSIIHNGDTNTKIRFPAADTITAETGGTERQRINSDGQLLINQTASSGVGRQLQIGSNTGFGGLSLNRFSADGGSSGLDFIKSRNATIGSNTIVQDDDNLGAITWRGADGTDFETPAAQIKVAVDGTPGSNDMPGRIMLFTTADGASSLTERLRIDNAGNVGIGITNPTSTLHLDASGGAVLQLQRTSSNASNRLVISHDGTDGTLDSSNATLFRNNGAERMRITSAGLVGIGTSSPTTLLNLNVDTEANLGSGSEGIRLTSGSSNAQFVRLGSSYSNGSVTGPGTLIYSSNKLSLRCDNGNPITFHTGSTVAERMRIDSSGRLLVGTTTEGFATYGDKFTIANSGHCGMTIRSGTSNDGNIYFSDGTSGVDEVRGFVEYKHSDNSLNLGTNAATRLSIDSSGRVGIGTTSPTSTLQVDGDVRTTNRLGVGTAANFANIVSYVTGTGSYPPSGGLVQADNADSTAMFWNASNSANYTGLSIECRTTGAAYWMLANVYNSSFSGDLAFRTRTGGSANAERVRFRREGGITFNGDTAAANALDDYEEGTWTPVPDSGTVTLGTGGAKYTRIGRVVFCQFDINFSGSTSTASSAFSLPIGTSVIYGSGSVGWTNRGYPLFVHVQSNRFAIMDNSSSNGGTSQHATFAELSGTRFIGDFRYFVA